MERLLERICALFPEGIPGERHGFGCIRRCDAVVALINSYIYYKTQSIIECTLSLVYRWPYNEAITICQHYLSALGHRLRGLFNLRVLSPPCIQTASSFWATRGQVPLESVV